MRIFAPVEVYMKNIQPVYLTPVPFIKKYKNSVFKKIETVSRGTSVESTVKALSCCKDGCGAFLVLVVNHAGDTKYRAIKKRMNLLQAIKWNGSS